MDADERKKDIDSLFRTLGNARSFDERLAGVREVAARANDIEVRARRSLLMCPEPIAQLDKALADGIAALTKLREAHDTLDRRDGVHVLDLWCLGYKEDWRGALVKVQEGLVEFRREVEARLPGVVDALAAIEL